MARLSLSDISTLNSLNPRFAAFLQAEMATGTPLLSCQDVTVQPNATSATLKLTLSAAPRDTIIGSWQTRNGTGTNQGTNYVAASGVIIWQPGEPLEKEITIQLKGNNIVGNNVQVLLSGTLAGAKLNSAKTVGHVYFSTDTVIPPSGMTMTYSTNFIDGFTRSPTGLDPSGVQCWKSMMAHNARTQPGNKELGYYADETVVPACNPYPIVNGRRSIQAEYFPDGVLDVNGNTIPNPTNVVSGVVQPFKYTSPCLTSEKMSAVHLTDGTRVEADIAMPLIGQFGSWPAFWLLPTSGVWPPEIDMMEWPIVGPSSSNYSPWSFFTTQHWPNGSGGDSTRGYPVDVRQFGATQDLSAMHTYGITINFDGTITFDFDGVTYVTMDNRSPGQTWYVILNLAIGGWPGAPTAVTQFPLHIELGGLRVYQLASS